MQTAQQWARKALRAKHAEEHKNLYNEVRLRVGITRSNAWSRAITYLVEKHREEYNTLRDKAIKLGYPNDRKY